MKKPTLLIITFPALRNVSIAQESKAPAGFTSLFNGKDLTNWKIPGGDNGHWKVVNGVIDYDALSEATEDKNLWTVTQIQGLYTVY